MWSIVGVVNCVHLFIRHNSVEIGISTQPWERYYIHYIIIIMNTFVLLYFNIMLKILLSIFYIVEHSYEPVRCNNYIQLPLVHPYLIAHRYI